MNLATYGPPLQWDPIASPNDHASGSHRGRLVLVLPDLFALPRDMLTRYTHGIRDIFIWDRTAMYVVSTEYHWRMRARLRIAGGYDVGDRCKLSAVYHDFIENMIPAIRVRSADSVPLNSLHDLSLTPAIARAIVCEEPKRLATIEASFCGGLREQMAMLDWCAIPEIGQPPPHRCESYPACRGSAALAVRACL